MNNLPQNELLSAYLDGELTAAEQAEVERLLAANPAARQLLDELRTLGSVLQSLPRQKLGEDLSEQVLRAAKQRMHREGEPDQATLSPAAPAPLPQPTIRERFFNTRAMFWTAMAVAIAVMIAVNERHEQNRQADKKLAMAPAMSETPAENAMLVKRLAEPPEMRPLVNKPVDRVSPAATSPARKEIALEETASAEKTTDLLVAKMPAKKTAKLSDGERVLSTKAAKGWDMEQPAAASGQSPSSRLNANAKAGPPPGSMAKSDLAFDKAGAFAGKTNQKAGQQFDKKAGPPADKAPADVLVVYCNVSHDALKKNSLNKLLDANGIAWQRHLLRDGKDRSLVERQSKAGDNANDIRAAGQEQRLDLGMAVQRIAAPDKAELVYIEATPAQFRATLAGLEAQPRVFLSYSVRPAQEEAARRFVHYFQKERGGIESKAIGGGAAPGRRETVEEMEEQDGSRGLAANAAAPALVPSVARKGGVIAHNSKQGETQKGEAQRAEPAAVAGRPNHLSQQAVAPAARPQRVASQPQDNRKRQNLDEDQFATQPPPSQLFSQSATPVQRVLFVLRAAGPPAAAAEVQDANVQDARVQDKAKAAAAAPAKAEATAPPATSPAEHAPSK